MADYSTFADELGRLVRKFETLYPEIRTSGLDEANLRLGFLDSFFDALGWDIRNTNNASLYAREVIVEPPSTTGKLRKRPDYLFRVGGIDKFICEAKRPRDHIDRHAFQLQNYVYNSRLWVGALSDFEFFIVYVVGAQPRRDRPFDPVRGWRLHYQDFIARARDIWDLFSREAVAAGSLERFAQSLPKASGRARQGWLLKPDRTRAVDLTFLAYLEDQRERLAKTLHDQNRGPDRSSHWSDSELTEATQRLIDRVLFQRICEDRDIDVGHPLRKTAEEWAAHGSLHGRLWPSLVANFRHMHRTFNGGIYGRPNDKKHFIDGLHVDDEWLDDFIEELAGDDSHYLFNIIPVEILGSVYERFLGKVVLANGKVVPKPEVRKAGGVFYTPRFISDYIIERTIGRRLAGLSPDQVTKLRVLDPACGSGSFLLRAFERLCQWYIEWLMAHPSEQKEDKCYVDKAGNLHLTPGFKRKILTANIFGVDRDPQAVEVTQMSLYLKVLEGENQMSLERDHVLFPRETYLPDLSDNIKCGNSLVGPDGLRNFTDEELETVRPFPWSRDFPSIMKAGGFDFVIGNPPYVSIQVMTEWAPKEVEYIKSHYRAASSGNIDLYLAFIEKGLSLLRRRGELGLIVPNKMFKTDYGETIRDMLTRSGAIKEIVDFAHEQVFESATTYTCLLFAGKDRSEVVEYRRAHPGPHIAETKARDVTLEKAGVPWSFSAADTSQIIKKLMTDSVPLSDFGCVMSRGSSSGADVVFCVQRIGGQYLTRDGEQIELEEAIVRRPIYATDFSRYLFKGRSNERIIFPYVRQQGEYKLIPEKVLKSEYPNAHNYLKRHKKALEARKQYAAWYSFSAPRNLAEHDQADFLVPLLANRGLYAPYPKKGEFCLMASGGFSIGCRSLPSGHSKSYVLGLLNSNLLFWHLQSISNVFRGGWITCTKQYVFQMPMRLIDFSVPAQRKAHDDIADLSDRLVNQHSQFDKARSEVEIASATRNIGALEEEMNLAVCDLYGLSAAERAHISEALGEVDAEGSPREDR